MNFQAVERRRDYRLPFEEKIIFTDGESAATAYAVNISRGGVFAKTLDPFPLDTRGYIAFMLPHQSHSFCVRAKVAHLVFDKQRAEVECGMGVQFLEMTDSQKAIINLHILNEQRTYLELKKILAAERPDGALLAACLKKMPSLASLDLLGLRYRVNRICTIFETPLSVIETESSAKAG